MSDLEMEDELRRASALGNTRDVVRLLGTGVRVDGIDKDRRTALHYASQQENLEVAKILVNAGATVDAQDAYGNSPLWRAVFAFQGGKPALIKFLLEAGANADVKNNSGRSPRDMARTFDRPGIREAFPDL